MFTFVDLWSICITGLTNFREIALKDFQLPDYGTRERERECVDCRLFCLTFFLFIYFSWNIIEFSWTFSAMWINQQTLLPLTVGCKYTKFRLFRRNNGKKLRTRDCGRVGKKRNSQWCTAATTMAHSSSRRIASLYSQFTQHFVRKCDCIYALTSINCNLLYLFASVCYAVFCSHFYDTEAIKKQQEVWNEMKR